MKTLFEAYTKQGVVMYSYEPSFNLKKYNYTCKSLINNNTIDRVIYTANWDNFTQLINHWNNTQITKAWEYSY